MSAVLAVLAWALSGCGGGHEDDAPVAPGTQPRPAGVLEPAPPVAEALGVLPAPSDSLQLHRRLAEELSNVDPEVSGWESEAFSEAIGADMNAVVASFLMDPANLPPARLAALVEPGFACVALRPPGLEPLFERPEISIKEGVEPEQQAAAFGGIDGFAEALRLQAAPFAGSDGEGHAKFKVMHVERRGESIHSRLLFEMSAHTSAGWVQATSTWHADWTAAEPWQLRAVRVSDYREATPGTGRLAFADIAGAVLAETDSYHGQLARSFDHWRARSDRSLVADLLGAQGIAVGDINGDHLDDVYVLQPGGLPNRLFLHQDDGSAIDVSRQSGVDILDFCRSALFIDADNDGDQDLAVGLAWTLVVFENDGAGRFSRAFTFASDGQINSIAAADYDNDGLIDLYICGRDASGEIKAEQGALGIPMPYYDANNGGPNTLLRNTGSLGFRDVTAESGMNQNNRRFSLACAWEDFDNDGDQDLYVANDFGRNNLFRNDGPAAAGGGATFTDIAEAAGVVDIGPGMSAAWGDHNGDGLMDLYVGNMWSNAGNRITLQQQFLPGADAATKQQARRHARGNSVYLNNGDGTFRDVTAASGANMARWAWSSNFTDLNNDGLQDLVVANGMITAGDSGDL